MPTKRTKPKATPRLKKVAQDYKEAYKEIFKVTPVLTYDGTWIRIQGQEGGVSIKRLKELTAQLRNRKG